MLFMVNGFASPSLTLVGSGLLGGLCALARDGAWLSLRVPGRHIPHFGRSSARR